MCVKLIFALKNENWKNEIFFSREKSKINKAQLFPTIYKYLMKVMKKCPDMKLIIFMYPQNWISYCLRLCCYFT